MIGLLFGILPLLCDLWTWMSTREWPVGWILTRWIYSLFLFIFAFFLVSCVWRIYIPCSLPFPVACVHNHGFELVFDFFCLGDGGSFAFYTDFPFHVFLCLRSPFGLLQASWLAFCTFRDTHHTYLIQRAGRTSCSGREKVYVQYIHT